MLIWTTPQLNKLFIEDEFPLKLVPEREIVNAFLQKASINDIALINIYAEYLDLLASAKAKGLKGPIILISPEPTIMQESLHVYNSILLDLKKTGVSAAKEIIKFILKNLFENTAIPLHSCPEAENPAVSVKAQSDRPVEDSLSIIEVLQYMQSRGISVIASLQIPEDNTQLVTTRGTCKIKSVSDNGIFLHEFRPSLFLKAFRESSPVKTVLAGKDINYEANLKTLKVMGKEVLLSLPEKLFIERRKYLRVEPSLKNPISLYLLLQDDPTICSKVSDISQRGIGFICSRDLGMGTSYSFTIILPDPTQVVVCYGTIKYKRETGGMYMYGADLQIHARDEEAISQYIMKRETEIVEALKNI